MESGGRFNYSEWEFPLNFEEECNKKPQKASPSKFTILPVSKVFKDEMKVIKEEKEEEEE